MTMMMPYPMNSLTAVSATPNPSPLIPLLEVVKEVPSGLIWLLVLSRMLRSMPLALVDKTLL
jgi:hypothetical protein